MTALTSLLLAAAVLMAPGPAGPRSRLPRAREIQPCAGQARWRRPGPDTASESLELAGAWDLLAACLRAGMPVPSALRAVTDGLCVQGSGGQAAAALRRTAELLALGAHPGQAWRPALECLDTARLARAAQRSGHSGTALADSLTRLATDVRAAAREHAEARAQRAGVLITAPLGLCFLPAFLTIGVVPVLIGLAAGVLHQ